MELTLDQLAAVRNGEPIRLTLPELADDVVVLRAERFEAMTEQLEDERVRRAFRHVGYKSAARWLRENQSE